MLILYGIGLEQMLNQFDVTCPLEEIGWVSLEC